MESNLEAKFPLSRRKFWKKIFEKVILFFAVSFLITFLVIIVWQSIFQSNYSIGWVITGSIISVFFLFAVISGCYSIYVHYYIKTYHYSDDGDFITIQKGVFAPTEIHVQYLKIQDVYVDQDILDRIMGLYDVHISSATYSSGIEAHIDGIEKQSANNLKELLLGKIKHSGDFHQNPHSDNSSMQSQNDSRNNFGEKVKFSKKISSEVYGLSSDWWVGEIVKLSIGSVFIPFLVLIWFYFDMVGRDGATTRDWRIMSYIWLATFVFVVVYRFFYLIIWKLHYKYDFGEDYIYIKTGILSVSEKNMGYNTIQDVKVKQSFIDRIFGVADLVIENASPGGSVVIDGNKISGNNSGIVIEGLSLVNARKIAVEMKKVIFTTFTSSKGL